MVCCVIQGSRFVAIFKWKSFNKAEKIAFAILWVLYAQTLHFNSHPQILLMNRSAVNKHKNYKLVENIRQKYKRNCLFTVAKTFTVFTFNFAVRPAKSHLNSLIFHIFRARLTSDSACLLRSTKHKNQHQHRMSWDFPHHRLYWLVSHREVG